MELFGHSWLLLLLLLVSCYYIILIGVKLVKTLLRKLSRSGSSSERLKRLYMLITSERIITQESIIRRVAMTLLLGFMAGYTTKTLQHYRSIQTMYGLHVTGNNGVDTYFVEDKHHAQFELKFCKDYIPEFPNNSDLVWITYEQTPKCLNIKDGDLGFKKINHDRAVTVSNLK